MGSFNDKVALVTGGGSGLGEAIATTLAAKGVKVVLATSTSKAPRVWQRPSERPEVWRAQSPTTSPNRNSQSTQCNMPLQRTVPCTTPSTMPASAAWAKRISRNGIASFMTGGFYLIDGGYTSV